MITIENCSATVRALMVEVDNARGCAACASPHEFDEATQKYAIDEPSTPEEEQECAWIIQDLSNLVAFWQGKAEQSTNSNRVVRDLQTRHAGAEAKIVRLEAIVNELKTVNAALVKKVAARGSVPALEAEIVMLREELEAKARETLEWKTKCDTFGTERAQELKMMTARAEKAEDDVRRLKNEVAQLEEWQTDDETDSEPGTPTKARGSQTCPPAPKKRPVSRKLTYDNGLISAKTFGAERKFYGQGCSSKSWSLGLVSDLIASAEGKQPVARKLAFKDIEVVQFERDGQGCSSWSRTLGLIRDQVAEKMGVATSDVKVFDMVEVTEAGEPRALVIDGPINVSEFENKIQTLETRLKNAYADHQCTRDQLDEARGQIARMKVVAELDEKNRNALLEKIEFSIKYDTKFLEDLKTGNGSLDKLVARIRGNIGTCEYIYDRYCKAKSKIAVLTSEVENARVSQRTANVRASDYLKEMKQMRIRNETQAKGKEEAPGQLSDATLDEALARVAELADLVRKRDFTIVDLTCEIDDLRGHLKIAADDICEAHARAKKDNDIAGDWMMRANGLSSTLGQKNMAIAILEKKLVEAKEAAPGQLSESLLKRDETIRKLQEQVSMMRDAHRVNLYKKDETIRKLREQVSMMRDAHQAELVEEYKIIDELRSMLATVRNDGPPAGHVTEIQAERRAIKAYHDGLLDAGHEDEHQADHDAEEEPRADGAVEDCDSDWEFVGDSLDDSVPELEGVSESEDDTSPETSRRVVIDGACVKRAMEHQCATKTAEEGLGKALQERKDKSMDDARGLYLKLAENSMYTPAPKNTEPGADTTCNLVLPKDDPRWKRWGAKPRHPPSIWCSRMMKKPVQYYVSFRVTSRGPELCFENLMVNTPTIEREMVVKYADRFSKIKSNADYTFWQLDVYCEA